MGSGAESEVDALVVGTVELSRTVSVIVVSGEDRDALLRVVRSVVDACRPPTDGWCTAAVEEPPRAIAGRANHGAVPPPRTSLSAREQETLAYIAHGLTHSQIAARMRVSKATVDTYVARIRGKLGLGNKAELALAALEHVQIGNYPTI
jgi:DNA-binding NarL/FixJ family response regulator